MKLMASYSPVPIILTLAAHVWVTAPALWCPLTTGSDTCPPLTVRGRGSLPRPGTCPASSGDSNSRTRKISEAAAFNLIDCVSNSPTRKISGGAAFSITDCFFNSPTRKISGGADIGLIIGLSDRFQSYYVLDVVLDQSCIVLTQVSCCCWCCLRWHRHGPGTGLNVDIRAGLTAISVRLATWPCSLVSVTPPVRDPCQENRDADINVDHVSICIGDDGLIVTDHSFIRLMPEIKLPCFTQARLYPSQRHGSGLILFI